MPMACIICMAMYGNGVQTGMALFLLWPKPILQDLQLALGELFVAAPIPIQPNFAVHLLAFMVAQQTVIPIVGFVWLSPLSFLKLGKRRKGKVGKLKGKRRKLISSC